MSEDRTPTGAAPVQDATAPSDLDGTQALSPPDGGSDERARETVPDRPAAPAAGTESAASPSPAEPTPAAPSPPPHTAPAPAPRPLPPPAGVAAAAAGDTGAGAPTAAPAGAPTTVLPSAGARPARPSPPRVERPSAEPRAARPQSRPAGRRRARLVVQRVDAWSVFLFSLVASICLGVVLVVAVAALYAALSSLGVLGSLNSVLGEVAGSGAADEVVEPFITSGRVLGATAVLAAIDVVLLTALATLGALLYNLCASLTGGIEVQLGERD